MSLKESKQSNCLVAMYLNEMPFEQYLTDCLYSICEQTKPVDLAIFTYGLSDETLAAIKLIADKPFFIINKKDDKGVATQEKVEAKNTLNYSFITSNEPLNFSKIFNQAYNLAVDCGYEFVSLAEAEDSFSLKWFNLAEKYSQENKDIAVFLPLIRNTINGTFTGLLNEAAWAEGMSEEAGKMDINLLMKFNCINPLGAVYKVEALKEYSEHDTAQDGSIVPGSYRPMKESIKLSHYYEFFLRMIYNDLKVMTVPRLGYELRVVRKGIYTDSTCKLPADITSFPTDRGGISQDEGRFWFELAKKEYFFDSDRCKTFSTII